MGSYHAVMAVRDSMGVGEMMVEVVLMSELKKKKILLKDLFYLVQCFLKIVPRTIYGPPKSLNWSVRTKIYPKFEKYDQK